MKSYWKLFGGKVDDLSLRERVMMFAAAGFVVISVINSLLLDPLTIRQKSLSLQIEQQQEKNKELQAELQALLLAKQNDATSPLRLRIAELKILLGNQEDYLKGRRDRLVEPEKMAHLLEQVLSKNSHLQLVSLKTLPVSLLIDKPGTKEGVQESADAQVKQIYKHGVQISVRGTYLDLLNYVSALERMPTQMFWAEADLVVEQHPDAVLTLVLYTLSLDKTWLTV